MVDTVHSKGGEATNGDMDWRRGRALGPKRASVSGVLGVTAGTASSLHSFVFFFFPIHGGSEA